MATGRPSVLLAVKLLRLQFHFHKRQSGSLFSRQPGRIARSSLSFIAPGHYLFRVYIPLYLLTVCPKIISVLPRRGSPKGRTRFCPRFDLRLLSWPTGGRRSARATWKSCTFLCILHAIPSSFLIRRICFSSSVSTSGAGSRYSTARIGKQRSHRWLCSPCAHRSDRRHSWKSRKRT